MADNSQTAAGHENLISVIHAEPMEDPYNKAISYLEKHNILQLFQHLTTDVIFHRPDDPLNYLIKEVQQMKQQREAEQVKKN